ncbi:hypothetical protein TEPIDINF_000687 [Tepidibacillus infernus]|uniref:Uncharacterized protein n=1 Tax=Tepidibacillus decaturensis TaxID=1413211 RepID=A0A135L2X1_9BACI|nr:MULTISPECIES: hypothetical protein [Tepidibacillus]KXG43322.1 hypothetical protein U473_04305 [Tepidibacillus decaturensis]GBF11072.1 hypothetical protein HK1_01090 [Tepidibacillus sp. HK-1]
MAIAPCPIYGNHKMLSRGDCSVVDADTGQEIDSLVGWYQCDCGERFICGGWPHFGGAITDYCTEGAIKGYGNISSLYLFEVDSNLIYYTDSSTLPGYQFCTSDGNCRAAG